MDNPQLLLDACIRGDEETACRLVRFLDGSDAHAVLSSLLLGAERYALTLISFLSLKCFFKNMFNVLIPLPTSLALMKLTCSAFKLALRDV